MNKKILNVELYIWLLFLSASLFFVFFSDVDLYISSFFYDGSTFPAKDTLIEQIFYQSLRPLLITITLFVIAVYLFNFFKSKNFLNINGRVFLYIILVLSIAPGLIVNAMLKENWDRARPHQTVNFGGTKEFTPAFIPTNQDGRSFSSGHAAGAFSLIGLAFLAKRRRKLWMSLALTYGVGMGVARIAAGGHFFSDVVTSFFIVYIATKMLYALILKDEQV